MSNNPIVDIPSFGEKIIDDNGALNQKGQSLIESIALVLNSGILNSYTVATVPDATKSEQNIIYVSDETGGAVPAFSDGTNWLRATDRTIIS